MYKVYLPKGIMYFPDGQKVELYSIGVIADVLAKDWRTIRDWELRGLIPLPPFCDKFGRRLYTKQMIRCISQCAEEYKIPIRTKKPFKHWAFFQNLAIRLERLYAIYKARLEVKMPEKFQKRNNRYIREVVINSDAYKKYMKEKEIRANVLKKERHERYMQFLKRIGKYRADYDKQQ